MSKSIFEDPKLDALRNAIYHTARSKFFELLNRVLNFIVIILGTAVVSQIAVQYVGLEKWIAFGVVWFATVQLVFDFGGKAGTHAFLQKRYYDVLADMEMSPEIGSVKAKGRWNAKLLTIAGDETITMRALDAVAFNNALDILHSDEPEIIEENLLYISVYHRLLKQLVPFQATHFVPKSSHRGIISLLCRNFRTCGETNGKT